MFYCGEGEIFCKYGWVCYLGKYIQMLEIKLEDEKMELMGFYLDLGIRPISIESWFVC